MKHTMVYKIRVLLFLALSLNLCNCVFVKSSGKAFSAKVRRSIETRIDNKQYNEVKAYIETTTTEEPPVTEKTILKNVPGNNLFIGNCRATEKLVYTDNTILQNGGKSIVNGTLEIYIDAPLRISCILIIDQVTDGTGGIPTLNSGGIGFNWVKVDVQALYGKGFHFKIHVFGKETEDYKNTV